MTNETSSRQTFDQSEVAENIPEWEWPEYQRNCLCSAPIAEDAYQCDVCEAEEAEFMQNRCCSCNIPIGDGVSLCTDCDDYYAQQRLDLLLMFELDRYWWRDLWYFIRNDAFWLLRKCLRH